jgi:hypothetical protein
MKFSTKDRDNDLKGLENCALSYGGGSWYTACGYCFVNGAGGDNFLWYYTTIYESDKNLRTSRMWLVCR